MKQPRVPEYREAEGVSRYLKSLILFLKDFTSEAWTANNQRKKEIENVFSNMPEIEYPVTSVNGKKGDVVVISSDPREAEDEDPELGGIEIGGEEDDGTDVFAPLASWPIGSIYTSVEEESPASLFGGTWEQLKDRFLLGAGDAYELGATGGEAEHTLTIAETPKHAHNLTIVYSGSTAGAPNFALNYQYTPNDVLTGSSYIGSSGGDAAHNNMPPYLVVYMWKRVA